MKRHVISILTLAVLVFIAFGSVDNNQEGGAGNVDSTSTSSNEPPSTKEISDVTFNEIHRNFGAKGEYTRLKKEEEWKKLKGKCVEWEGKVEYVDKGWTEGIKVGYKHLDDTMTYDVLVEYPDSKKEKLLNLQKGKIYEYKGRLKNYGGVVTPITLEGVGCK